MNVKHPERCAKIDRLNYIINRMRVLQDITPARLAEELTVSQRTIYRDLRSLERGQSLKKRYSRREGRYLVETDLALPPILLTPAEALAIYSAAANPALEEPCMLAQELRTALRKLSMALAQDAQKEAHALENNLSIAPFSLSEELLYRPIIETLRAAQRTNRKVNVLYWQETEQRASQKRISPYLLRQMEQRWYLLGYCEEMSGVRLFRLDRIRRVEMLPERFRLPRRFDPEETFARAWQSAEVVGQTVTVRIKFSPEVAPAVVSSRGQQFASMATLPDGSLVCTAHLNHRNELNWWILSYGSAAEVLAPEELREAFALIAQGMAVCYQK